MTKTIKTKCTNTIKEMLLQHPEAVGKKLDHKLLGAGLRMH